MFSGHSECRAPLFFSDEESIPIDVHEIDSNTCMRENRCKRDQGEAPDVISCQNPFSDGTPGSRETGSCYLWGSDRRADEQTLFVFLLRIDANTRIMTLHYLNNSQSSQQYSIRQHFCTAGSNLDLVMAINESCRNQESPPEVLPNEQITCCSNVNVTIIDFDTRMMEIHAYNSIIKFPVEYLNCTRKFTAVPLLKMCMIIIIPISKQS
jgi:hypothetical protein